MDSSDTRNALRHLGEEVGFQVLERPNELFAVSYDGLKVPSQPEAHVKINCAEQVGELLRLANELEVPVTCRGTGSSLTGGATPIRGGWVLDLSDLNAFEIDEENRLARCQPGVVVADLQAEAEKLNLFYPPDPSSKKFCTIGGNLACNAGGLRCVKYGVTRDYVLSLSGYLANGKAVRWGRDTRKFATGYNMRDLWIGSEGTLGVITSSTLRLVAKPQGTATFLAAFEADDQALSAPLALSKLGIQPSILEYMDSWTINCLQEYVGEEVFTGVSPRPMLLVELDGPDSALREDTEKLVRWLSQNSIEFRMASNEEESEKLWEVRRQGSSSMKKLASTKLNEDVVVPLDKQIELIAFVNLLRRDPELKVGVFGHCGDGNLHVNFMYDEENEEETRKAVRALGRLMSEVIRLGGAISGEHGVGLAKTPFVREQFNGAEWEAMKAIKLALDPKGILNPGKIFDLFKPWEQKKADIQLSWELSNE